ncbi:MAG: hypothetical protein HY880_04740 [Deltaproteobacteria bacterium]|nr:hypothetical protein [Deltaproteobacteria bacterium]
MEMRVWMGISVSGLMLVLMYAAGCAVKTTGEVKEDVTITKEREALKGEGLNYTGPQYSIAILSFNNKTPSKTLGIGEAATDIMRTLVKESGLEPVVLSEGELKEQEKLIALTQTGALKKGAKDPAAGFDSVDFRLSGSVTSYAEYAETSDVFVAKTKVVVSKVQVDYALVDVATGRSLVANSGMGEYKKQTREVLGFGTRSTGDVSLRDGALRDALTRALKNMMIELNSLPFTGRVLLVDKDEIFIRAGTKSKLSSGARLAVYHYEEDLIDPETGRVLGKKEEKAGEITIKEHQDERISRAVASSGSGFRKGDVVKEIK